MNTFTRLSIGLVVLSFFLGACDKDAGKHEWVGRALEYDSGRPVAGAQVYLWEAQSDWLGQKDTSYRIDSVKSAVDGSFRFRFHWVGGNYYWITGTADRYYSNEGFLEPTGSRNGNLILFPHSWVRIHVKNVHPFDRNDAILINLSLECDRNVFFGANTDTFAICSTKGNVKHSTLYTVTRANGDRRLDSIVYTTVAWDTIDQYIHF